MAYPLRQGAGQAGTQLISEALHTLGVFDARGSLAVDRLPFAANDSTAGTETELQVAVAGSRQDVDLPLTIEASNYFANVVRRTATGDLPGRLVRDLERILYGNRDNLWENSWVRFERKVLNGYAAQVFAGDLRADKTSPSGPVRTDTARFVFTGADGGEMVRVPVSYLVKLAMAQYIGSSSRLPLLVRATGTRLMAHYLNDNTSPETFSFHVVPLRGATGMGLAVAREASKRMLLTQLLVMYANRSFGLRDRGQQAMVYFAPLPPLRQKALNEHISDSFYRDLFMSPCLSGWDRGEEKYHYMRLCHKVLSRSQLNAVAKLKHAGIIQNNLVVLPNTSNVSLANNGTHVSLGSRVLSGAMAAAGSGFTDRHEKYLGDLVIKIVEHFLPLFTGTYSAAPYRLAFGDFHPEKALGFLAHQLDYSQLRILWRLWKAKAKIGLLGTPLTPFGPEWLDRLLSVAGNLRGDCVHDYRLLDYLVTLLSTERSPALDGSLGSGERLKDDLAELGVFDPGMSLYLLVKLREYARMGFSGFESRQYSLFASLRDDMAPAVSLQNLIHAFAFKLIAQGSVSHGDIPDTPHGESERRQIIFGDAIGLRSFYVRKEGGNRFMARILSRVTTVRSSNRYPQYLKVKSRDYRLALLQMLDDEAGDLVEMLGARDVLEDLRIRLWNPERTAAGRLTGGILQELGARQPLAVPAAEFNSAAERYYRTGLSARHMAEAFSFLEEDLTVAGSWREGERSVLQAFMEGRDAAGFVRDCRADVLLDRAPEEVLRTLIGLLILSVHQDTVAAGDAHGS